MNSDEKYPVGTKLEWPGEAKGVVVKNPSMSKNVCVKWDVMPEVCPYDADFLDKHTVTIVEPILIMRGKHAAF